MNKTLFQFFHWYYTAEGNLWNHCKNEAARLASLGVTDVWLPPAYKSGKGADEPGYAVYDLYDLGEFDQKGTVRTRYGTKDEYIACINALHENKIGAIADIVFNHKYGGDEPEQVPVLEVKEDNRLEVVSEPHMIESHTRFTFPGRQGKYSNYIWDWHSFTGVCVNDKIKLIMNEYCVDGWDQMLEEENGNYDYLMCNDIEFRNPYVVEELKQWGKWYVETTSVDGFRLDALKHINPSFFPDWLNYMNTQFEKSFFCVGEYWQNNISALLKYIEATNGTIQLFDVPLHFNFHEASIKGDQYDMRTIFNNTLLRERPELAISFVDNHDTQPLQSLQSPVDLWFKPIAYALILLREQGIPCVFYPAIYGAKYTDKTSDGNDVEIELHRIEQVETMMKIRRQFAYGNQRDYFDHSNVVGWTRQGIDKTGCAVLLTNAGDGEKWMCMGEENAGKTLIDVSGNKSDSVMLNEQGEGLFKVKAGTASVWIDEQLASDL